MGFGRAHRFRQDWIPAASAGVAAFAVAAVPSMQRVITPAAASEFLNKFFIFAPFPD
jgi:hypothetical protein